MQISIASNILMIALSRKQESICNGLQAFQKQKLRVRLFYRHLIAF